MDEPLPFGQILRRYRQAAFLTQEALAETANISTRAVSDLERGLKTPRLDTLELLANALGLPRVDGSLGPVEVDPSRLKQVLYNYLSNAIKFTPPDGRISISVTAHGDDACRIAGRDTGPGIAPHELHRLFTEFAQIDSRQGRLQQGTGPGLAPTKRIVEAQGGTVGVRSTLGKGSTFIAVLPRRYRASAATEYARP